MTEYISPLPTVAPISMYTSTVMHSIPRDKVHGLVREFERVVRPGGTLAIVEMAKRETAFGPPVWQRYSSRGIAGNLFIQAGEDRWTWPNISTCSCFEAPGGA